MMGVRVACGMLGRLSLPSTSSCVSGPPKLRRRMPIFGVEDGSAAAVAGEGMSRASDEANSDDETLRAEKARHWEIHSSIEAHTMQ